LAGEHRRSHPRPRQAPYVSDQFTIKKILDHLGLSPPEVERPPPDLRYAPVDHEGRELEDVAEQLAAP
jgi:hypothetical protein